MTSIGSLLAIALYLLATIIQWRGIRHGQRLQQSSLVIGFGAISAHAVASFSGIITPQGMHFSLLQALSMITWFICTITLLSSLKRPLENLLVLLYPLAILVVSLTLILDRPQQVQAHSTGVISHILLSVLAYSVLTIAAVQAIVLALQEYRLKHHQLTGVLRVLPPLQTMEQMLFELISIGFVLLTFAIASGLFFVDDFLAQHLVHKTVFSIAAWLVFATLLWGRHQLGWRSKTAIRWTLWGFSFLLLAYIGTKVVLELILQR